MNCLTPEQLLTAAVSNGDSGLSHMKDCSDCQEKVAEIRALAAVLQSNSSSLPSSDCLGDSGIARMAEGNASSAELAHAAKCGYCRERLSAVMRLLEDPVVSHELAGVTRSGHVIRPRWSRDSLRFTGALALAAAAAIVLLGPVRSRFETMQRGDTALTRETSTLTSAAPQPVAPTDALSRDDSLRWTAVPQADLYRIRVWNTEGTVVWTADTRDTKAAIPDSIRTGVQYLWEVKARTGWDRWVSSELFPLTIRSR